MRASSNSSPGDKARRPSRMAPRRHTEPNERPVSATYDSNEFPVLLRMPDLREEVAESSESVAKTEHRLDLQPPPTQSPSTPGTRRFRSKHKESTQKQSTTASASRTFWGTLAPKIAVGGMLLSVTALCVVVLQGPSQDKTTDTGETNWAVDGTSPRAVDETGPTMPASDQASPTEPAVAETSTARHAVAAKPEPIRATPPNFVNPVDSADVGPTEPAPSAASNLKAEWPGTTFPPIDNGSSVPSTSQPFQAQGWPDDIETSATAESDDMQLQLNAAAKSAQRPLPMRISNSTRGTTSASAPPAQPPAAGTRLNGTVEIPNPRADYRL